MFTCAATTFARVVGTLSLCIAMIQVLVLPMLNAMVIQYLPTSPRNYFRLSIAEVDRWQLPTSLLTVLVTPYSSGRSFEFDTDRSCVLQNSDAQVVHSSPNSITFGFPGKDPFQILPTGKASFELRCSFAGRQFEGLNDGVVTAQITALPSL